MIAMQIWMLRIGTQYARYCYCSIVCVDVVRQISDKIGEISKK